MLIAGLLGGLVNYCLNSGKENEWDALWKSLIIGVGASFLVPVFLNMISSDLINQSQDNSIQLLVFAGFSLIASISSKAFISNISQRVLKEAQEAKEQAISAKEELATVQTEFAPILEKETEQDTTSDDTEQNYAASQHISSDEEKILKTLGEGEYALRSISGIKKDSGLTKEVINTGLNNLINKGLAVQTMGKKGLRWYITQSGRRQIASN
jgi:hypothetical protein